MAKVSLHRAGRLGILKVQYGENFEFTDRYAVYPEQPGLVMRFGPVYTDEATGQKVATGHQMTTDGMRWLGWFVDDEQEAEIEQMFRDAIAKAKRDGFITVIED